MKISRLNTTYSYQLIVLCYIGFISTSFSQDNYALDQKIRDTIRAEFSANYSACLSSRTKIAVTDFNNKTEIWKICVLQNNDRIIQIESHAKTTYFQEIYFEKNGTLSYAKETENYTPINSFEQMQWNCEFYVKENKVVSIMSLGHGKTENEEWNEDSIIDMYTKRIAEIDSIQQ